MNNISQIIEKIKQITSVPNDRDIAKILDMSGASLSNHKKRNSIPFQNLLNFCAKRNISFDSLLLEPAGKENIDGLTKEKEIDPEWLLGWCYDLKLLPDQPIPEKNLTGEAKLFSGNNSKIVRIIHSLMLELLNVKAQKQMLEEMLEKERNMPEREKMKRKNENEFSPK